jgi:predicted O-methyltransferase YrrM
MASKKINKLSILVNSFVLLAATLLVGLNFSSAVTLGVSLTMTFVLLCWVIIRATKAITYHQNELLRQTECYVQLMNFIKPKTAFPVTRGYAGSPDFLLQVYSQIMKVKPKVIVEASSGISSLVSGYALEQLGEGRVFSLEHDQQFAQISQQWIRDHQLEHRVAIYHAPLKAYQIKNATWQWYDFSDANLPENIDMLIVDGPPNRVQKSARYPALPLLKDRLSNQCVILVDDAARKQDKQIIALWQKEFPQLQVSWMPSEKGMAILHFKKSLIQ